VVIGVIGVAAVAAALSAQAQTAAETVFVMTNAASRNEVIACKQSPNGKFYEANRYATGGRGSGGVTDPLQSQGSLTLSQDHTLLFVANAGSGTVSVFRVGRSSLSLVDHAASGGREPLAIAQFGNLVYVLNAAGSAISGFASGRGGALTPVEGTVVGTNPQGSTNLDIAVSGESKYVYTLNSGTGTISVFAIQSSGALSSVDEIGGLPKSAGFNGIAPL
jgi:DNA-binding beta-propeller fold protein YncE